MIPAHKALASMPEHKPVDALFDALYFELHRLAKRELARQWDVTGLSVTTILHETYLSMASRDSSFPDNARFIGYAARVMRGIVIDRVRSRQAIKRGGDVSIVSLEVETTCLASDPKELSHIADALDQLAQVEPELAEVVDLKFFCGFSFGEIASMRKLSERTVQRRWEKARVYLHHSLHTERLFPKGCQC